MRKVPSNWSLTPHWSQIGFEIWGRKGQSVNVRQFKSMKIQNHRNVWTSTYEMENIGKRVDERCFYHDLSFIMTTFINELKWFFSFTYCCTFPSWDKWAPKINSAIPPIDIHTPLLCQFIFGNSKITRTPCISDFIQEEQSFLCLTHIWHFFVETLVLTLWHILVVGRLFVLDEHTFPSSWIHISKMEIKEPTFCFGRYPLLVKVYLKYERSLLTRLVLVTQD